MPIAFAQFYEIGVLEDGFAYWVIDQLLHTFSLPHRFPLDLGRALPHQRTLPRQLDIARSDGTKIDLSIDLTAFQIKFVLQLRLIVILGRVLHDDDVNLLEGLRLNAKEAVDPREQRLVVRVLQVLDVVIKDADQHLLLVLRYRLQQKLVIIRKEEKGAARPRPLARLKHLLPVLDHVQGLQQSFLRDTVHPHDFRELFMAEAPDRTCVLDAAAGIR